MRNKILKVFLLAALVISTSTACGTDQTAAISTNNTSPTVSESAVSEDVVVADDTPDETVTETEGARTSEVIDLAFEITSDIDVYDYGYADEAREYILKDTPLTTGTLIHAFRETSDGYYQIEYGTENGYILKDSEGLSETEIGYLVVDMDAEYELIFDYIPYVGPSVHYGKGSDKLLKGDVISIIGIAENGWLKTSDGYFISPNGYVKEKVEIASVCSTPTTTAATDTATTTVSTTTTTTAPATTTTTTVTPTVTTTGVVTTEVQARDKINTFMASYPMGMTWDYSNSYTAQNGKTYVACDGFAYMLSDYLFGNAAYTSIPVNFNTIRIGDILTVNGNSNGANYGHRCVCIGINPSSSCIITADGNWSGTVHYGAVYEIGDIIGVVTRYTNTSWTRGGSTVSSVIVENSGYYFGYSSLWHNYANYMVYYSDGSMIGMGGPLGTEYYNANFAGTGVAITNGASSQTATESTPIVEDGAGLLSDSLEPWEMIGSDENAYGNN